MRLTEDVNDAALRARPTSGSRARGDPARSSARRCASIAALYDEHGVLLRAIVEVSTYDEEVAGFWRGLMGASSTPPARASRREQAAGARRAGHREAIAFALCWMTERVFYQQLVPGRAVAQRRARRRALRDLGALGLRALTAPSGGRHDRRESSVRADRLELARLEPLARRRPRPRPRWPRGARGAPACAARRGTSGSRGRRRGRRWRPARRRAGRAMTTVHPRSRSRRVSEYGMKRSATAMPAMRSIQA